MKKTKKGITVVNTKLGKMNEEICENIMDFPAFMKHLKQSNLQFSL